MRNLRLIVCSLLSLLLAPYTLAADTTVVTVDTVATAKPKKPHAQIYQGTTVKLDIATPAIVAGVSRGRLQQYELAVNVRLRNHFYPTLEAGYAGGRTEQGDTLTYNDHGGFFRVGLDINPLRKHPESPHALLIGIRIGTGFQPKKTDCWGEIVAGCQVEIAKVKQTAFYMGWMGRLKILFTRQPGGLPAEECWPIYIPGFGHRDSLGWGLSYHLGWRF